MKHKILLGLTFTTLLLAGCGGGGGGGGDGGGDPPANQSSGPNSKNHVPVANAGKQQNVKTGALVRLDGSASSDADGNKLTYDWRLKSRPAGSKASLRNADTATPLFRPDVDGHYIVRLVVGDGTVASDPTTVTVVASPAKGNSVPVADAGQNQSVKTGAKVTLDGSASSDADNEQLSYRWTLTKKPDGSKATLSQADTVSPSFTADAAGQYVARLVVNDGTADSKASQVTIDAAKANAAPVANAGGDRGVAIGATVKLDGSGRDADGDKLAYRWRLISRPKGSSATVNDANTATPTFVADAVGPYVAQLTVSDGKGASASDRAVITAVPSLKLAADLGKTGTFKNAALPYDKTFGPTVCHAPNSRTSKGFVVGKFKVTAVGGDVTLNLNFSDVNKSQGAVFVGAFDGFQGLGKPDTKQVVIPAGKTVLFTLNVGISANLQAKLNYGFTAVETGDRFAAHYSVASNDQNVCSSGG